MHDIAITERFLMDTGGWQAMKHAKALVEMGRVVSFNYTPPVLRGVVRDGDTEYRSGLKIKTYTDVENLCTCRDSRQWGTICAHSLALGLAHLKPAKPITVPGVLKAPQTANGSVAQFSPDSQGKALELHVVLPPNLESGWVRGQIVVGFEVGLEGKRLLAGALDSKLSYRCNGSDAKVLEKAREINGGKAPGMLIMDNGQFLELIGMLLDHPRVTIARKSPVMVRSEPVLPKLQLGKLADHRLQVGVTEQSGKLLVGPVSAWLWAEPNFRPVSPGLPAAYLPLLKDNVILSAEQGASFLQRELSHLKPFFEIEGGTDGQDFQPGTPEIVATFEGSLNHLTAKLQCLYGKRILTIGAKPRTATQQSETPQAETPQAEIFVYETNEGPRSRNLSLENECSARLQQIGFRGPLENAEYRLSGQNAILNFFARDLPLLEKEWKVSIGSRFEIVTRQVERVKPALNITGSGEDWFDFTFSLESSAGDRFSAAEIQRLLQMGQSHVKLKNGRLAVFNPASLREFESILYDSDPQQTKPGSYRVARNQAGYLDSAFREVVGGSLKGNRDWNQWVQTQQQLTPFASVSLGSLEDVLRSYQKEGVYWLRFLSANGLGGILADEMGLGKTIQALAFIRMLSGPSLVVCPSSLVFNWIRESKKFVPELKVLPLEGAERNKLFSRIPESNLVITSYPLLRRDIDRYRDYHFAAVILDEATHIKNPDSQNAQAAMALRGRHRFVLTGTPIENSVRDLWSILEFVMPGYLGKREDFRERYELPIGRGSEPERVRLGKRVRPIMLRRLKQQVAKELPEKIEQTQFCELTPDQRELYTKLHGESRRQVEELLKDQGRARMAVLTALLRLRQVCCDLRLLGQEAERPSSKIELLFELLEEAIDGDHRVLIFSQFVSMLQLIKTELDGRKISFCYLDGQTKDRGREIDRFQLTQDIPVFLISLKAGGTGLNLSAADTVIHFDPWWNPAVEAQATDRAHRIGQTKVVTSYKLITRNTVEEKILNLQRKKRELTETMVENEEPMMTGLTVGEIAELFED